MSRAFDVLVAGIALCFTGPLMLVIALIVRACDGRPVLFRQMRCGRGGTAFRLRKFRTMSSACDDHGNLLPDAQRITAVGRILRATRLDELPQLINIIAGDMAIIGPRPLPPAVLALTPDGGRTRSTVRPGLTGWAQVNGNASLTDADKLALDAWYIANRSITLDAAIVARTLLVMLKGERVNHDAIRRAHARSPYRRG